MSTKTKYRFEVSHKQWGERDDIVFLFGARFPLFYPFWRIPRAGCVDTLLGTSLDCPPSGTAVVRGFNSGEGALKVEHRVFGTISLSLSHSHRLSHPLYHPLSRLYEIV